MSGATGDGASGERQRAQRVGLDCHYEGSRMVGLRLWSPQDLATLGRPARRNDAAGDPSTRWPRWPSLGPVAQPPGRLGPRFFTRIQYLKWCGPTPPPERGFIIFHIENVCRSVFSLSPHECREKGWATAPRLGRHCFRSGFRGPALLRRLDPSWAAGMEVGPASIGQTCAALDKLVPKARCAPGTAGGDLVPLSHSPPRLCPECESELSVRRLMTQSGRRCSGAVSTSRAPSRCGRAWRSRSAQWGGC